MQDLYQIHPSTSFQKLKDMNVIKVDVYSTGTVNCDIFDNVICSGLLSETRPLLSYSTVTAYGAVFMNKIWVHRGLTNRTGDKYYLGTPSYLGNNPVIEEAMLTARHAVNVDGWDVDFKMIAPPNYKVEVTTLKRAEGFAKLQEAMEIIIT